jgi:hypothetical protein
MGHLNRAIHFFANLEFHQLPKNRLRKGEGMKLAVLAARVHVRWQRAHKFLVNVDRADAGRLAPGRVAVGGRAFENDAIGHRRGHDRGGNLFPRDPEILREVRINCDILKNLSGKSVDMFNRGDR